MFKNLGTIPVTTCECERSIYVIRRLKTFLRSTMWQERFAEKRISDRIALEVSRAMKKAKKY